MTTMNEESNFVLRGPELKFLNKTFGEIIFQGLKNGGTKIAMVNAVTDEKLTYNTILKYSINLANYLKHHGLTGDDTLAICSENNLDFCIPVISGLYLGITVAPISCDLLKNELLHVLKIAKPKVVFTTGLHLKKILEVSKELDCVRTIIILGNYESPVYQHIIRLHDIIWKDSAHKFVCPTFGLDQSALLVFSSGTTGLPKGVLHAHKNLQVAYAYNTHRDFSNFNSSAIGMTIHSFYASFGLVRLLCMLVANMKIIFLPKFEKSLLLRTIEKYRVSNILLTSSVISFLATSPEVNQYDVSSLTELQSASSSLGKDVTEQALKRFNKCNIRQVYGLTETMAITMIPSYLNRPGSVGVLLPGWECKIINPDTLQSLDSHQRGELWARGPSIMNGYVANATASAELIDKQGWVHTGDMAYYDNDGFIYIVDRYKDIIKFKGYQVSPVEIEDVLLKHSEIIDCAVIGKPDATVGELSTAFIVTKQNSQITDQDIIKYVTENVSYPKRLHGGVIFMKDIPKNSTGKILRRLLKERLQSLSSKL